MSDVTVIGRGAHVRGRIVGDADLEIHGHVEGDVTVGGELLVEAHGLILANLSARRMVIRGAVKGDLTAEDAVLLEDGARVVGDIRAPRVAIAPGALVRGYVQTGEGKAVPARATQARAAQAAQPARTSAPNVAAKPAARPVERHVERHAEPARVSVASTPRGAMLAGASPAPAPRRSPPSPVVPALKKGAKGALKAHSSKKN